VTAELGLVYCPDCRRECLTEIPPCADGHGERCPDRACVECGAALWSDFALFAPAAHHGRAKAGSRAGRTRRVA
jgi:hypothetical protein